MLVLFQKELVQRNISMLRCCTLQHREPVGSHEDFSAFSFTVVLAAASPFQTLSVRYSSSLSRFLLIVSNCNLAALQTRGTGRHMLLFVFESTTEMVRAGLSFSFAVCG